MQVTMKKLSNMPAKISFIILFFIAGAVGAFPQSISMNTTGAPPNASAGLDVDFTNLGMLLPRVALTGTANSAPLAAHVAGMMVYNTATAGDVTPAFYFNDGTRWILCESDGYTAGDMMYWNGSSWALIPAGQPGQNLQLSPAGVPVWVGVGFASLISSPVSAVTATTATSGGNIFTDGGFAVTARGVCWNTAPNPTTALTTKTADGTGAGIFTSSLTGLTTATTYYLRAYATNSRGTVYGNQVRFVTP
jgi:hypothetical protein